MEMINLTDICFSKSFVLKKVLASMTAPQPDKVYKIFFRVSFYSVALDRVSAPVTYSEQTELVID